MDNQPMFLDCPAYQREDGAVRCGLPAEVEARYVIRSTDGPLETAKIRCPRGHWFNGPIESLTMAGQPAASGVSGRARSGPRLAAATPRRLHRRGVIAALIPPAPPVRRTAETP
jgi:hypothetical protein